MFFMLYVQQKNEIMKTRKRDNCEVEFVISRLLRFEILASLNIFWTVQLQS